MKKDYKRALRSERKASSNPLKGFVSDLFPVSWSYHTETITEETSLDGMDVEEGIEKTVEEGKERGVTEKTKILDSFHEFADKLLDPGAKAFNFGRGEIRKKEPESLFENSSAKKMDLEALAALSSSIDENLKQRKFPAELKGDVQILFVAEETLPVEELAEKEKPMEAFFELEAAKLFEKMTSAMRLKPEEFFVSSLNVLKENKVVSFKECLLQEIYNLKPRFVIPLGGKTTSSILGSGYRLQSSHGQFFERTVAGNSNSQPHKFHIMPLFSPAFLLEAPNTKRIAWEDMQKVMQKLGL